MTKYRILQGVAVMATLCMVMPKTLADNSTVAFGYANQEYYEAWGTGTAETYDVALGLTDPDLVGKTIKGVRIPVDGRENNTNWKVWLTTKLKVGLGDSNTIENIPNVASYSVTPTDDMIEYDFAEPYIIPEGGVYVGFSFTATNSAEECQKPMKVVREGLPGGLWMRTSYNIKSWADRSVEATVTTAMKVILEGEFPSASLSLDAIHIADGAADAVPVVETVLFNRTGAPVSSIDYTYEIDGESHQGHMDFETPLAAQWGRRYTLNLPLRIMPKGNYSLKVTVDKVNGEANQAEVKSGETILSIHSSMPKHNAVIEEYTGTWCGWCPRGWVGMEMMSAKYPDFIAICYHGGADPMTMAGGYPDMVSGFPSSLLDRVIYADPYMGTSKTPFGIEQDWLSRCEVFSPVSVVVAEVDWNPGNHNQLDVTANVEWLREPEDNDPAHYRMEYVLLSDDLKGTTSQWAQTNYYFSKGSDDPNLSKFTNATSTVTDMVYNDVAVLTSGLKGVEGSIKQIVPGETETHTYSFDVSNAVNKSGERLIQNRQKLKVVALLLNTSGEPKDYGVVLNAGRGYVKDYDFTSGVEELDGQDNETVSVEYFDLAGVRVSNPRNGIYVEVSTQADGRKTSKKTVIK